MYGAASRASACTQDYWVFGHYPSSGIPKNTKDHNVTETGSVSILRRGVGDKGPAQ
jgi:hypothetical protein